MEKNNKTSYRVLTFCSSNTVSNKTEKCNKLSENRSKSVGNDKKSNDNKDNKSNIDNDTKHRNVSRVKGDRNENYILTLESGDTGVYKIVTSTSRRYPKETKQDMAQNKKKCSDYCSPIREQPNQGIIHESYDVVSKKQSEIITQQLKKRKTNIKGNHSQYKVIRKEPEPGVVDGGHNQKAKAIKTSYKKISKEDTLKFKKNQTKEVKCPLKTKVLGTHIEEKFSQNLNINKDLLAHIKKSVQTQYKMSSEDARTQLPNNEAYIEESLHFLKQNEIEKTKYPSKTKVLCTHIKENDSQNLSINKAILSDIKQSVKTQSKTPTEDSKIQIPSKNASIEDFLHFKQIEIGETIYPSKTLFPDTDLTENPLLNAQNPYIKKALLADTKDNFKTVHRTSKEDTRIQPNINAHVVSKKANVIPMIYTEAKQSSYEQRLRKRRTRSIHLFKVPIKQPGKSNKSRPKVNIIDRLARKISSHVKTSSFRKTNDVKTKISTRKLESNHQMNDEMQIIFSRAASKNMILGQKRHSSDNRERLRNRESSNRLNPIEYLKCSTAYGEHFPPNIQTNVKMFHSPKQKFHRHHRLQRMNNKLKHKSGKCRKWLTNDDEALSHKYGCMKCKKPESPIFVTIRYFLIFIVMICWLPCFLLLFLFWLITYPMRPHECKYGVKKPLFKRFIDWLRTAKWYNLSFLDVFWSMLHGSCNCQELNNTTPKRTCATTLNVIIEKNMSLERRKCKYRLHIPSLLLPKLPNKNKLYSLGYTTNRGWVVKPLKAKNVPLSIVKKEERICPYNNSEFPLHEPCEPGSRKEAREPLNQVLCPCRRPTQKFKQCMHCVCDRPSMSSQLYKADHPTTYKNETEHRKSMWEKQVNFVNYDPFSQDSKLCTKTIKQSPQIRPRIRDLISSFWYNCCNFCLLLLSACIWIPIMCCCYLCFKLLNCFKC